jgi:hypothetical protein
MPWGRARYVDGSVFRFSSYPLSRTQPTTIRYELAGYKKELLLKALAEDYENRGGTLIPLTLNRVVRETEVRQGARVLLKRDDEVRGDSIERFSEMTMSSSEWEAGLSSGERLLIDVTYRRYWATAVDGAVCGAATRATTIFNDSPFVPVEAGPQVQN